MNIIKCCLDLFCINKARGHSIFVIFAHRTRRGPVAALTDASLSPAEMAGKVETVSASEPNDGLWTDSNGRLFFTAIQESAIKMQDGSSERKVLVSDPRLRVIDERRRGISPARNAGLAAARGDLVAFTDDDAVPDPAWISAIVDVFDADLDGCVSCVTGLVTPAEQWGEVALDTLRYNADLNVIERFNGTGWADSGCPKSRTTEWRSLTHSQPRVCRCSTATSSAACQQSHGYDESAFGQRTATGQSTNTASAACAKTAFESQRESNLECGNLGQAQE